MTGGPGCGEGIINEKEREIKMIVIEYIVALGSFSSVDLPNPCDDPLTRSGRSV